MSTIPKDLPPGLRTEHFLNDIHHSMFLILFVNLFKALREGRMSVVEHFIDNITLYLFIHFLAEEEGMAHSLVEHGYDPSEVERHTGIHVAFVKWWNQQVFTPFKDGAIGAETLYDRVYDFCERVIDHIDTVDMVTYGPRAEDRANGANRNEAAQIAVSKLPLSPFQAGAFDLMMLLAPRMTARLNSKSIAPTAREPLPALSLAPWHARLWGADKGAFRDVVVHAVQGYRARVA